MAGINKASNGKWRVQLRRRGVYASKTFFKKSDADTWACETELQIDRGQSVISRGTVKLRSFGDLVGAHIADMEEVGKPLRRSKGYSLNLLKRRLGKLPVRDITRQKIVDYGRGRALEGAGPATLGAEASYIKTVRPMLPQCMVSQCPQSKLIWRVSLSVVSAWSERPTNAITALLKMS